jgi:hypothetical protein
MIGSNVIKGVRELLAGCGTLTVTAYSFGQGWAIKNRPRLTVAPKGTGIAMARYLWVTAALLASVWVVCAADQIVGVWKLNVKKSNYVPGPAPGEQTRTYTEQKGGIRGTIRTVFSGGKETIVIYPVDYDGKEHPVEGSPDMDGIEMKKVDQSTSESKLINADKVIGVARRSVSDDGKSMIITYEGMLEGEKVKNTAYYERQ